MPGIVSYRDLIVWQRSMDLAESCYKITAAFPKEELYGLTSQIRRAAVSVPSNIAEGNGRENTGAYIQFLRISQGSLKELETQLLLASRIGITAQDRSGLVLEECEEIGKMLRSLIRSLQSKIEREG